MDINKLNFDISSDIEMLHLVPSFEWFTNNRGTLSGVYRHLRGTFDANKVVFFFVMSELI